MISARFASLVLATVLLHTVALHAEPLQAEPLEAEKGPAAATAAADDTPVRVGPQVIEGRGVGVGRLAMLPEVGLRDGSPLALRPADRATVLVMTSTTCPLSRKWLPIVASLERDWRPQGVRVVLVDVQGANTADELDSFLASADFQGEAVHDPGRSVARALGAGTTTEAFLLDDRGTIRYRGAIDDRLGLGYVRSEPRSTPLVDAIEAVLADRAVEVDATTSPGCELGLEVVRPVLEGTPTWHGSISRLLDAHCVGCHQDGGIAPFPLDDEMEARANAGMIARQVSAGLMPPWFAAPSEDGSHSPWINDRALSQDEREAIVAWARNGRPSGDPTRHPRSPASEAARLGVAADWTIGPPDRVVSIPEEIEIPAEGYLDYVNIVIDPEFEEDRWVEAWEVIPTALDAVHHVLVFLKEPGRRLDQAGYLAAYVPGYRSMDYADPRLAKGRSIAKRIPAGSQLVFQLHYTPNGQATSDRTRLGLRFAEEAPETEVVTASVSNRRFKIPPGAAAHPVEAFVAVPRDVELLTLMPHMHLRGRSFRYDLESPDGDRSTLLDVPRYDFNWQLNYVYREPRAIERGSRLLASATFDNSDGNPANPDPTATVRWGDQTYEEMMIGYFEYLVPFDPASGVAENLSAAEIFALLDRNRDGKLSRRECPQQYRGLFGRLDTDGNRRVTLEELEAGLRRYRGQ